MDRPVTPGFHHVALATRDAERSIAFYRDGLGLALLADGRDGGPSGARRLWFGNPGGTPGALLCLVEREEGRGRPGIGGVHHTALGVEGEDGLLRWKRRLRDLGWAVSGPYDRGYFTSLYFRDPDGQILEIATAGPGYAIDEPADALGGELMLPPQRIVRGHRDEAAIAALVHPEPVPDVTPDMALASIHHVSGITDDLERAGEFYEAALGLRLVKRTVNRDDPEQLHYFWARYEDGEVAPHSSYTLFGWPGSWNRARAGAGQTVHIAFRAGDFGLDAWADHLRSLGAEVREGGEASPFASLRFRAPDGQVVEIAADGPGLAGNPRAGGPGAR